jgi:hypothetical protein
MDSINKWTHWAARIEEKETGARFAVDSSSGPNGDNPMVQAASSFYVPDSYADRTPPERGEAVADAQAAPSPAPATSPLTRMLRNMDALGFGDGPTASVR